MTSKHPVPAGRLYATESLSDRAYELIRDKILRGQYPLGTALSRRQLAKELRMSFVPVSEALQHLELDGLVESKPRVGTRVRTPTAEEILERYGLREALETQAARLCVEHADERGRQELLKMGHHLDQLYASSAGADDEFLYSVHKYHMRFHLRAAEIGGNSLLREAIEREQVPQGHVGSSPTLGMSEIGMRRAAAHGPGPARGFVYRRDGRPVVGSAGAPPAKETRCRTASMRAVWICGWMPR